MNAFQWMFCTALALAAAWELIRFRRGASTAVQWLVRSAVWILALVAIADPLLVTAFANAIGIGRGADVVLYLFVLAFLASTFWFYSRTVRLERQIGVLVQHLAIAGAQRGPTAPTETVDA
jgi:hypothetical protein